MENVNKQLLERWSAFGKAMQKAGSELPRHLIAETEQAIAAAEQAQRTCQYCDGTGDVHSITGEWRGVCSCEAGQAQQAEPVAEIERIVKKLRYYGEVTDGRMDNPERKLMREAADMLDAQPPAVAVPSATDDELEEMAKRLGMRWDGDFWAIEDADFHPFMRAMLAAAQKGGQ